MLTEMRTGTPRFSHQSDHAEGEARAGAPCSAALRGTRFAALADRHQLGLDLTDALDRQADGIRSVIAHRRSSSPLIAPAEAKVLSVVGDNPPHQGIRGVGVPMSAARFLFKLGEQAATYAARSPTPPSRQGQSHRGSGVPAEPLTVARSLVRKDSNPSRRRLRDVEPIPGTRQRAAAWVKAISRQSRGQRPP